MWKTLDSKEVLSKSSVIITVAAPTSSASFQFPGPSSGCSVSAVSLPQRAQALGRAGRSWGCRDQQSWSLPLRLPECGRCQALRGVLGAWPSPSSLPLCLSLPLQPQWFLVPPMAALSGSFLWRHWPWCCLTSRTANSAGKGPCNRLQARLPMTLAASPHSDWGLQ